MRSEFVEGVESSLHLDGALRRVATLVAELVDPESVFDAVADEAGVVLGLVVLGMFVFERTSRLLELRAGVATPSQLAAAEQAIHRQGVVVLEQPTPTIGVPLLVDGHVWGALTGEGPPASVNAAGGAMTELGQLLATSIGNAARRDVLHDLAESQAALRRVAMLVAQDADPQAVFEAVASEASRVLRVGAVSLIRYDAQAHAFTKIFGTHGDRAAVADGDSWPVADAPEGILILETGRPVRLDDWTVFPGPVAARHVAEGFGQAIGAPVLIDGRIWGHISAFGEAGDVLPPGSEDRLADLTQLMSMAIANAQAREELRSLAAEQGAALRRVATLVAGRAPAGTVFGAIAAEASRALRVQRVDIWQTSADQPSSLVASTMPHADPTPSRRALDEVLTTGVTTRLPIASLAGGASSTAGAPMPFRSGVAAPVFVDGATWGAIVILSVNNLPDDADVRLADFTHLLASSIANVQARKDLMSSRARIVAASDEARRRIERNLHDGIQQRVVSLGLGLRTLRARHEIPEEMASDLEEVERELDTVLEEIRVFSQGLHPALLSRSGLGAALRSLARRSTIPAKVSVIDERFSEAVEAAAYYTVSEAMANATKHSGASGLAVVIDIDEDLLRAVVADDGCGGVVSGAGTGLVGLVDRAEALGGAVQIVSPPGIGTKITITLPTCPLEDVTAPPSATASGATSVEPS